MSKAYISKHAMVICLRNGWYHIIKFYIKFNSYIFSNIYEETKYMKRKHLWQWWNINVTCNIFLVVKLSNKIYVATTLVFFIAVLIKSVSFIRDNDCVHVAPDNLTKIYHKGVDENPLNFIIMKLIHELNTLLP